MIRYVCDLCGAETPERSLDSMFFTGKRGYPAVLYKGVLVEWLIWRLPERIPPGAKRDQFPTADLCQCCLSRAAAEGRPIESGQEL